MTPRIAVVGHSAHPPVSTLQRVARQQGWALDICRVALGEPLPDCTQLHGVVLLGAPCSTYQAQELDWLRNELRWLEGVLRHGVPAFGVCFGCQMLAQLHGGEVYNGAQGFEFGYSVVRQASPPDALFGAALYDVPVFQAHGDTYTLPHSAVRLLSGTLYPEQAAKFAPSVYGVQFHPEITGEIAQRWHQSMLDRERPLPRHVPPVPADHAMLVDAQQPPVHDWLAGFLGRLFQPPVI